MGILKKLFAPDDEAPPSAAPRSAAVVQDAAGAKPAPASAAPPAAPRTVRTIIRRPIVTEKSSLLKERNRYVFAVAREANKGDVARAVEEVYGVRPLAVHAMTVPGKIRRRGRRRGEQPTWKKAIVTLPAGKTIRSAEGA